MNKNRSESLKKESISKLLIKMSIPATAGMIIQALYNVVDTIFVGKGVGALAIGALSISFPIQLIIMALAQAIGVGAGSLIALNIGKGDYEKANKIFGNVVSMTIITSIVITVFGLIFLKPIMIGFGATETILPYSLEYTRIIFIGSIFFIALVSLNTIIRSEGNSKLAMLTMMISALINIVLDPILIIWLKMGVKGAAIATIVSQLLVVVYMIYYFLSNKSILRFSIKNMILEIGIVIEVIAIGASAFARQAISSVIAIILNNILKVNGGDSALIVYGIINKILVFAFMPMYGVLQGMQPIVGINYGAKQIYRVKKTIYFSTIANTILGTAFFLLVIILPHGVFRVFTNDESIISAGTKVMWIVCLCLPTIGFQIIGSGVYQAIGKAKQSFILSIARQGLFLIPLVFILPIIYGMQGVWIAFPIADGLGTIFTYILIKKEMRKMTKMLETV